MKRFVARPAGWQATSDEADERLGRMRSPDLVWRGMTAAEYDATVGAGRGVRSRGDFSFAREGTQFAEDPRDAESYANFGRDDPRRTKKPTYLVAVRRTPAMRAKADGYIETHGEVAPADVMQIWRFTDEGGDLVADRLKGIRSRGLRGLGDIEEKPRTVRHHEGPSRPARAPNCKIKPRDEGGFKTGLCQAITITDHDGVLIAKMGGRAVGEMNLEVRKNNIAAVEFVMTDPSARRCGVGTRLYEAAVKWACRRELRLASDTKRTELSECFWRKQVARGRAVCESKGAGAMKIDSRMQDTDERWDCEFYALKKRMCFGPAPSLRGRGRKKKSTRRRRR